MNETMTEIDEFEADIIELFEKVKIKDGMILVMNQQVSLLKQSLPDDITSVVDDMFAEMPMDELVQLMIPIFRDRFTRKEVNELLEFYNSPVGMKLVSNMDAMSKEAAVVGEKFGEEHIKRFLEKEGKNKTLSFRR